MCIGGNLSDLSVLFGIKTNLGKQIGQSRGIITFLPLSLYSASLSSSALLRFLDGASILVNFSYMVPTTCPNNREFLRFSDVWDSYDQWEHRIPRFTCHGFYTIPGTYQEQSAILPISVNMAVLIVIIVRIDDYAKYVDQVCLTFM